jgi:hypothetical protein
MPRLTGCLPPFFRCPSCLCGKAAHVSDRGTYLLGRLQTFLPRGFMPSGGLNSYFGQFPVSRVDPFLVVRFVLHKNKLLDYSQTSIATDGGQQ